MPQPCQRLGFTQKPLQSLRCLDDALPRHLERNVALQDRVVCAIHGGVVTLSQNAHDPKSPERSSRGKVPARRAGSTKVRRPTEPDDFIPAPQLEPDRPSFTNGSIHTSLLSPGPNPQLDRASVSPSQSGSTAPMSTSPLSRA